MSASIVQSDKINATVRDEFAGGQFRIWVEVEVIASGPDHGKHTFSVMVSPQDVVKVQDRQKYLRLAQYVPPQWRSNYDALA